MTSVEHIDRTLEHLPDSVAAVDRARIRDAWERGVVAWPGLSADPNTFVRLIVARIDADDAVTFSNVAAHEIYLAAAIADGQRAALDQFEDTYLRDLSRPLAQFRLGDAEVDEIRQKMREKLLVSPQGQLPGVCRYVGRGGLGSVIHVTAYREALDVLRRQGRQMSDDDRLLVLPAVAADPDLAAVRRECSEVFVTCFREAVAALDTRSRNMLRLRYADGLAVDGIAGMYGMHRTSVSRSLSAARRDIASATRRLLSKRLNLPASQLSSLIRAVDSDLDLSLGALFQSIESK